MEAKMLVSKSSNCGTVIIKLTINQHEKTIIINT